MSFLKKFTQGLKSQRKSLSETDFYHIEPEKDKLIAPTPIEETASTSSPNLPYPHPISPSTNTHSNPVPSYKANKVTCPSCGLSLFNQDEAKVKSHIDSCSADNNPPPNKPPTVNAPLAPNTNVTNKYFSPATHNPYPGTVPVTYNMPPPYNPSYAPPSNYPPPQQPQHTYVQPQVIAYYPPPPNQYVPPPPPPSSTYYPPQPPPQKQTYVAPPKIPAYVAPRPAYAPPPSKYVPPKSNPQPRSNNYDSPFAITCPYPGCYKKMEAHEFLQHVNSLHSGFSQAYSCPICPLLGYGNYQINKNTNLLQHVTKEHSDLQPISFQDSYQDKFQDNFQDDFPDDFPDDDDFQYDPSQFEDQAVIDPEALKATIGSHYIEETVKEYKSGTECSICYEEYEKGNVIARMDCFCVYHKKCIDSWLQKHKKCPLHNSDS